MYIIKTIKLPANFIKIRELLNFEAFGEFKFEN